MGYLNLSWYHRTNKISILSYIKNIKIFHLFLIGVFPWHLNAFILKYLNPFQTFPEKLELSMMEGFKKESFEIVSFYNLLRIKVTHLNF